MRAFFLALILVACGANQLKVAAAQALDLAGRADVERVAINASCRSLTDATVERQQLCIAAADKYRELVQTIINLADAIRAAEGKEDPNVDNVAELAAKAIRLEYELSQVVVALESA